MKRAKVDALAKLTAPRLPTVLHRSRLFQSLDRCRKRPVVWISGPPGAGKTTLVASYIRTRQINSLWYQIDESDEDIGSFFHHLGVAGERLSRSQKALPRMGPEHRPSLFRFAKLFFEKLYQRAKPPFLLVFDNYQEISSDSPLHELISAGLSVIPEGVSVVLLSRDFSPPSLSGFRVRRNLARVGPDAFRLTLTEARAIARLYARRHTRRSRRELVEMHRRLRGWTAGLVLLLENASDEGDSVSFSVEETWEVVFDFLAQEVFQKQRPETRRLLLETAFLPSMTASMAEELTGLSSASRLIAAQYRNRFFIERRESEDPVYQYHPLFREFLMRQAHREMRPTALTALKANSAKCLEKAGQFEGAMALLCELSDEDGQIRMIQAHASALLAQGRFGTLEGWVRSVPEERLFREPWLLYWLASCRLLASPEESESLFEKAFELFSHEENRTGTLLAWCGILDSITFEWRDLSRIEGWLQRFSDVLDADDNLGLPPELEARVVSTVFQSLLWSVPHDRRIHRWAIRALGQIRTTQDLTLAASTGHFLTVYAAWIGERSLGDEVVAVLQGRLAGHQVHPLARLNLHLSEGVHAWVTGEPEASVRALTRGLNVAAQNEIVVLDGLFKIMMIHPWIYRGGSQHAEKLLRELGLLMEGRRNFLSGAFHFLSSWIALLRGDARGAWRHAKTALKGSPRTIGPFSEACLRVGAALSLFEMGRRARARDELSRAERYARKMGSRMLLFSCHLSRSAFGLEDGDEVSGVGFLREAMTIGRARGFVDALWWQPEKMARLCARALDEGIEVEYVLSLIRRRSLIPPAEAPESWPWLVKVRALGGFEVLVNGEAVGFSRKAQRRPLSLLKAIVALGDKRVSEACLSDALWPDSDGDKAHQSLTVTLHRLRKLLRHPEVIIVANGFVTIDPALCWVDAWEFQSVAKRALHAADPNRIAKLANRALKLYRGHLLPDERDEPWSHPARERLRRGWVRLKARQAAMKNLGTLPADLPVLQGALEKRVRSQTNPHGLTGGRAIPRNL